MATVRRFGGAEANLCLSSLREAHGHCRFVPQRTLYLAFGHDEEVGGLGAEAIAKTLADEGVQLDCILDEGGVILADGFKPFTKVPIALIGTAEKVTVLTFLNVHKQAHLHVL